ncbi:uncharacterized protein LOC122519022 [Polistes fuscatus]|uniref:uncharacterized protein LOC122519022 n=1 Tax=Polistes fuscatus TaxID=30207 RepID=UPI001CA89DCB|nr:uncharacterized protein LOC122519022 [Polistes fuscatus]
MKDTTVKEDLEYFVSKAIRLIAKFDPSNNEFICWEQKFNRTTRRIELPDDMKVSFLLKLIEPHVLTDVEKETGLSLTELSNSSYKDLAHILQDTFKEVPVYELYRRTFRNRKQRENESTSSFLYTLEIMCNNCNFGRLREAAIKIQFCNGLRNELIQSVLWKLQELNAEEMLDIAKEMELHDRYEAMGIHYPYPDIVYNVLN